MKAVFLKPTTEVESYLQLGQVWGLLKYEDGYRVGESWYDGADRLHNYQVDELMQSGDFRLEIGQKILFMTAGDMNLGAGYIRDIRMMDMRRVDVIERPGIEYIVSLWDVFSHKRKSHDHWGWVITYELE